MILFLSRSALLLSILVCVSGCALQRAADAEKAQQKMVGLNKEQVFTCMGIAKRKSSEGATEIWEYKSTSGYAEKSTKSASKSTLGVKFGLGNEVSEKRFCTVQIIFNDNLVKAINYSGPTGGFLTEDEQCAYAIQNCLK